MWKNYYKDWKILKLTEKLQKKFAVLKNKYLNQKEFDLMIAAIYLSHNIKLLTEDTDFKQVKELETEILK